jgi:hypothetical protein
MSVHLILQFHLQKRQVSSIVQWQNQAHMAHTDKKRVILKSKQRSHGVNFHIIEMLPFGIEMKFIFYAFIKTARQPRVRTEINQIPQKNFALTASTMME